MIKDKSLADFMKSTGFLEYLTREQMAAREIFGFLINNYNSQKNVPGYNLTFNNLVNNSTRYDGQWWNYFSEIRCANFLNESKIFVKEYNQITNGSNNSDITTFDGKAWDVTSFKPYFIEMPVNANYFDYSVIEKISEKVIEKFVTQKMDYLIIDDIFSFESPTYTILPFLWDEVNITQKKQFRKYFGKYLDKILVLSFTKSMHKEPTTRYVGGEIKSSYPVVFREFL